MAGNALIALACCIGTLNFFALVLIGVRFLRVWQDYKNPR